jgi:hypothetical protein
MPAKLAPRPAPAGPAYPPVRQRIHDLAAKHGVVYVRTTLDTLADAHARLSDSEVALDETENLITALQRAGILSANDATDLHDAYICGDLGLS